MQQRTVDGIGECRAVRLHELDRSARPRVRVGTASGHEQRGGARMPLLQDGLRDARVIAVILHEAVAERRVVARVTEDDGEWLAVFPHDSKHRHRVIDRAIGRELHPSVRGKRRLAMCELDACRAKARDGVVDQSNQRFVELRGIRADRGPLLRRQSVRDRQLLVDHGTAVRVARVEEEIGALKAMAPLHLPGHGAVLRAVTPRRSTVTRTAGACRSTCRARAFACSGRATPCAASCGGQSPPSTASSQA